jgi:hypothetical protein
VRAAVMAVLAAGNVFATPATASADVGVPGVGGSTNIKGTETIDSALTDAGNAGVGVYGLLPKPEHFLEDPPTVPALPPAGEDCSEGCLPDPGGLPPGDDYTPPTIPPEELAPIVNLVTGIVTDVEGRVMEGVNIALSLLDDSQRNAEDLVTVVTDEYGRFVGEIPTTEELRAEAEKANGAVNLWIEATKYEAHGHGYSTYHGAGGFYSSMIAYNAGATGLALAPVNVGVLTVVSVTEQAGVSAPDPKFEVTAYGRDPREPS